MTHTDLDIWKIGVDLVSDIYRLTRTFPKMENYGLASQMQRSAISYPSNIAEGAARDSIAEYVRFVYISLGSLSELETQIIISKNLGYVSDVTTLLNKVETLRKMTLKFIEYLKNKREKHG